MLNVSNEYYIRAGTNFKAKSKSISAQNVGTYAKKSKADELLRFKLNKTPSDIIYNEHVPD